MNISNKKTYLIFFLSLFFNFTFAQNLDSTLLNGEQVYVYPFKASVQFHKDYYLLVDKVFNGRMTYKRFVELSQQFDPDREIVPREQFREIKKMMNSSQRSMAQRKYINKKFIRAARRNPYPLLEQRSLEDFDVVPFLDSLPDGKYIQFYEPVCIVDKKGNCQMKDSLIAGYFSLENNVLSGEAFWINLKGDTLKSGSYSNGLKEGLWTFIEHHPPRNLSEEDVRMFIHSGFLYQDTIIQKIEFKNGARNGRYSKVHNSKYPVEEGFYLDGKRIGEWIFRDVQFETDGTSQKRNRDNYLITEHFTINSNDSIVVKPVWIRNGKFNLYDVNSEGFNFFGEFELDDVPKLYEVAFEKDKSTELLENDILYSNLEYSDYRYYGSDFDALQVVVYDPNDGKRKKRGLLLDSLGGRPYYTGVYEKYYPNGQLMMKFQFKNGQLVEESNLYWDNGNIHDKITFIADSNHYLREIYDYDGKLYQEVVYDELGDFKRIQKSYETVPIVLLDGLKAQKSEYGDFFRFYNYDTLAYQLEDSVVLYKSWNEVDSSVIFNTVYNPKTRTSKSEMFAASGKVAYKNKSVFSEDFASWTGGYSQYFGDLELKATSSGALFEMIERDSIPQRYVGESFMLYDVTNGYELLRDGQRYTGEMKIDFSGSKVKISRKGLTLKLPIQELNQFKLRNDFLKAKKGGKSKYPILFDYVNLSSLDNANGVSVYNDLLNDLLGGFFVVGNRYEMYQLDETEQNGKLNVSEIQKIEGYLMDGKPQGVWVAYDLLNNPMVEVNFENGEANGRVIHYAYQYPKQEDLDFYEYPLNELDSFPKKRTHYIQQVTDYKNGFKDGKDIEYNWLGEVKRAANYKEGYLDGTFVERNMIAFTRSNYENGVLDGYLQTYLVLPKRDSILLFDLNFQDGMLQGESKSYHTNGRLAKRGFFLNGEPIEDYEAFDSLGIKYHYVKFKYSFPVEEKIWEENELSVRYTFDWQDSIFFEPSDITSSQSLETILYQYGYGEDFLNQPYYGRKSLVDKTGIEYHMTKYYPNDKVAREGDLINDLKIGCWKYYNYYGDLLYEVEYFDSTIVLNDSIEFSVFGIYSDFDSTGNLLSESYLIEKREKYDCAHSDHYEIRQFYTKWAAENSNRMNGYVKNYYDNGTIQSEGRMKDGLPTGEWRIYDPHGKLNEFGNYVFGKRNGRWLKGDLSKTKYLGDICLNPNLPDLEKEVKYRENLLDISIVSYKMGKVLNRQYYDIDMNQFIEKEDDVE